jgi:hypothetical protein
MITKAEHDSMRTDVKDGYNGRAAYLYSMSQNINWAIKKSTGSPIWTEIGSDIHWAAIFLLHQLTIEHDLYNEGCGLDEETISLFIWNCENGGLLKNGVFHIEDWKNFETVEGIIAFSLDLLIVTGKCFKQYPST